MQSLINLLGAIALLVWGTHIVRAGILRVYGEQLRAVLARSTQRAWAAALAGLGVTGLVQSATATCLLTASFASKSLITTAAALAIMLGADVGSALMALVFSFDLSWLSPLLLLGGVAVFVRSPSSNAGRLARVAIGLGLITLALQLIVGATRPFVTSPVMQSLLAALPREVPMYLLVGAVLTVAAYSSMAVVLLVAALAAAGVLPLDMALGLVLGANVGSGLLAWFALSGADAASKRVPAGNAVFKFAGAALAAGSSPWTLPWLAQTLAAVGTPAQQVVVSHLAFNLLLAALGLPLVGVVARWVERWLPLPDAADARGRPTYLEESALATPSLALSCASREALLQADVVETMLQGLMPVIRDSNEEAAQKLRALDDRVDASYSAIKYYLTKISRESLNEREGRRWTDIMSFTINLEQIGDIIERVLQDIEDRKIRPQRSFSAEGVQEIEHLHARLVQNLRLAMSVFLEGHVREAQMLLEAKAAFRDLERQYARTHLERLQGPSNASIETSSLYIDLLSDLKRINSHICALAYPILESAGALAQTRLRLK